LHNVKGSELPKSIDPGNFYITDDGNLYSGRNDMTPIHIGGSDINHLTVCDPATQITSDIAIAYLPLTGGVINGNLAVTGTINNIILDSNSKLTDTTYEPATQ
jgi:hypothetical protein